MAAFRGVLGHRVSVLGCIDTSRAAENDTRAGRIRCQRIKDIRDSHHVRSPGSQCILATPFGKHSREQINECVTGEQPSKAFTMSNIAEDVAAAARQVVWKRCNVEHRHVYSLIQKRECESASNEAG